MDPMSRPRRKAGNPMIHRGGSSPTYSPVPIPKKGPLTWMYGVTTVPERRSRLLLRTLASLKKAGFDNPRLFVDGDSDAASWMHEFKLDVTCHYPRIRAYGNWILGIAELYARNSLANFYAIFQDDLVTCKNLRKYLEHIPFPEDGYYNLYTFPKNQVLAPEGYEGFYESNQRGLGALALVFSNQVLVKLLTHQDFMCRVRDVVRGHRFIDGGVVTMMNKMGVKEYVHNPSLVQHTGTGPAKKGDHKKYVDSESVIGNFKNPLARSYRGEDFDCMDLLRDKLEALEDKPSQVEEAI